MQAILGLLGTIFCESMLVMPSHAQHSAIWHILDAQVDLWIHSEPTTLGLVWLVRWWKVPKAFRDIYYRLSMHCHWLKDRVLMSHSFNVWVVLRCSLHVTTHGHNINECVCIYIYRERGIILHMHSFCQSNYFFELPDWSVILVL